MGHVGITHIDRDLFYSLFKVRRVAHLVVIETKHLLEGIKSVIEGHARRPVINTDWPELGPPPYGIV